MSLEEKSGAKRLVSLARDKEIVISDAPAASSTVNKPKKKRPRSEREDGFEDRPTDPTAALKLLVLFLLPLLGLLAWAGFAG